MPAYFAKIAARARTLLQRWKSDTEGVAAIEFALIVPIMGTMFVGAVELSQAITVDRRVTQVAAATADLVARADKVIKSSEITDIMKVGGYIFLPYSQTPVVITLRNVSSSPTSATNTKQSWTCVYNGAGQTQACSCTNVAYTIPANLVTTNDSVVVSQVTYNYTPLIFNYFLKKNLTSTGGTYLFSETIYVKPRSQAAMLEQPSGTPCPSPTY